MGFGNFLKAVGSGIQESLQKRQQRILEYKEKYQYYDVDQLIRIYRGSNVEARLAAGMLLKEKGFSASDIENY